MSFHNAGKWTVGGLAASLSVSVLGYNLLENPEGFVVAAMFNYALEGVTNLVAEIAFLIRQMWGIVTQAFTDAGLAILAPFGAAGDAVLWAIGSVTAWLVDLASVAGPAAPLVALAVWSVVTIALVTIIERIVSAVAPWT